MNETKEITRLVNRHKARLLKNLENAQCPSIYHQAVRDSLDWLRADLQAIEGHEGDGHDDRGNR